jgi:hypothetical protein
LETLLAIKLRFASEEIAVEKDVHYSGTGKMDNAYLVRNYELESDSQISENYKERESKSEKMRRMPICSLSRLHKVKIVNQFQTILNSGRAHTF